MRRDGDVAIFDQTAASRAVLIEVANVLGAFRDRLASNVILTRWAVGAANQPSTVAAASRRHFVLGMP